MTNLLNEEIGAPTALQSLGDLRQKILDGQEPTSEEYAQVLAQLRRSRTAAPTKRGKAPAGPAMSASLDEFS